MLRKQFAAAFFHNDDVFDPAAANSRVVKAGLDCDDHVFLELLFRERAPAEIWRFVDVEPDAVPEAVEKSHGNAVFEAGFVAQILEKLHCRAVNFDALFTFFDFFDRQVVRFLTSATSFFCSGEAFPFR